MSEHLRAAREYADKSNIEPQPPYLRRAIEEVILHLEAQESAPPLTEERVQVPPETVPIVERRVLVEPSIHDKLDRILAWIDKQPAQAVGVTTVPGDVGE